MQKTDYKKVFATFYKPSAKVPAMVDVPPFNYLMIDGSGAPDPARNPAYAQAIEALFSVAYTLKFSIRNGPLAIDYGVMPLEGLWWADDMNDFITGKQDNWQWTMMIMQPDVVTSREAEQAIRTVASKKSLPALPLLRYSPWTEGAAAQILHVGPFSEEGPTVARLHDFILASGHQLSGKHHEIYLSDIRRADPSRWKTVLRQPLK